MEISNYLPFWDKLTYMQQQQLQGSVQEQKFEKGTILHSGSADCIGLLIPLKGQLRVYFLSEEGKEVTLYRLFEQDMCLFSASCMMKNIEFDVIVMAEQDTTLLHIPTEVYKSLMEESVVVSNYTNEVMASRFSDVMWLMDQVLSKKLDTRLAAFLIEESRLEQSENLTITHEQIAHHLGSAREVITRMLKYFQTEQLVKLTRGKIQILDEVRMEHMASASLR